ncbi:MAG TPA: ZIP family metal transporter [Solirubrobacteraceae bacterium]|nr:ZIP family metal transporter [Solirubrobacteraceae bacterium]
MSFAETVLLGAIAGFTIYIGLPLGRMERVSGRTRLALAMFSVGILAFIFMDVSAHGEAIIEAALRTYKRTGSGLPHALGLFALLAVGFTAGAAGIGTLERRLRGARVAVKPPVAGGEQTATIPAQELRGYDHEVDAARRAALRTGMTIALAIGLHNFAEGLAIGVSAKSGAIGLATVLVIGFALHNATEGFGIVGPLGGVKPTWRWLAVAGLIGGGPTFLGTIVGYQVDSAALQLTFYALAGGAILYVIGEIWTGVRRLGHRELGLYMLAFGFLVGIATDLVVGYGGA